MGREEDIGSLLASAKESCKPFVWKKEKTDLSNSTLEELMRWILLKNNIFVKVKLLQQGREYIIKVHSVIVVARVIPAMARYLGSIGVRSE